MTKQSDGKTTTISTNNKVKPAQNQSEAGRNELSDTELEKAAGGVAGTAAFKKG
jgi:hypothetical protein